MIIFDLDGTLANCEHRRHFVDHMTDQEPYGYYKELCKTCGFTHGSDPWIHKETKEKWNRNFQAFYEACDKDAIISQTRCLLRSLACSFPTTPIDIWSGRCESVKNKTRAWLGSNGLMHYRELKMRSIGDNTPDDQLKERWLDEALAQGHMIDFVFDDRPKVIRMWRKRGIFVFNCAQNDQEF